MTSSRNSVLSIVGAVALFAALAATCAISRDYRRRQPETSASKASATSTVDEATRRRGRHAELETSVTSNQGQLGKPVALTIKITNLTPTSIAGPLVVVRNPDELVPTRILGGTEENALGHLHRYRCGASTLSPAAVATCSVWFTTGRTGRYDVQVKVDDLYTAAGSPLEETVSIPVR